jgi:hypothetical protein
MSQDWPVRLTVTDRFGRTSSDFDEFRVLFLSNERNAHNGHWECRIPDDPIPRSAAPYMLVFETPGPSLSGTMQGPWTSPPFLKTFTGFANEFREVRLSREDGVSFDGFIGMSASTASILLTQRGGTEDGQVLSCGWWET